MVRFPKNFLWGASSAAYQVEGNNIHSDMWAWERKQGWSRSGACCNSWELFDKDVDCLSEIGANAYRFSIEWARLFPKQGELDQKALSRYVEQIGCLKSKDITPIVCLHHFTNPAWLVKQYPSLWADERVVDHYLEFVRVVTDAVGGAVNWWLTFNEPMVYVLQSLVSGYFPPGRVALRRPLTGELMRAVKNLAVAHRQAYRLIKQVNPLAKVSVAQNIAHVVAHKQTMKHQNAAHRWDYFFHWMFLDALAGDKLDADLDGRAEMFLDEPAGDFPSLRNRPVKDHPLGSRDPVKSSDTLDFVGVNYYTRVFVRSVPFLLPPLGALPLYPEMKFKIGTILSWLIGARARGFKADSMGHEIYPEGLLYVMEKAHVRYGKPIMVTENGVATKKDVLKGEALRGHVGSVAAALAKGIDVRGYLYWSLLDNYEWGSYAHKFGLYRVARKDHFKRVPTAVAAEFKKIVTDAAAKHASVAV